MKTRIDNAIYRCGQILALRDKRPVRWTGYGWRGYDDYRHVAVRRQPEQGRERSQ